jgi:hypothetical protein
VIVSKLEFPPLAPALFEGLLVPAPPAPTVMVYVFPGVTAKPVPVRNPPAPPPPPYRPPPPPPATIRYSTDVTPVGAVHVVVLANVSTTISCCGTGIAPLGFKIREELRSVLRKNDFVAIR